MTFNLDIDLNDISLEDIAAWPFAAKAIIVSVICLLIIVLGTWISVIPQLKKLQHEQQLELNLRQDFEMKQHQAANLSQYQRQMAIMKQAFGIMLNQLPSETEVPGLLEDISEKGMAKGLHFYLIKPLGEKKHDFYAELPIEISVRGRYHQLAEFVSDISCLRRIVTVGDFDITTVDEELTELPHGENTTTQMQKYTLQMEAVAKTYRYYSEAEKAAIKAADKKNKESNA